MHIMKKVISLILYLIPMFVNAQSINTDSLEYVLETQRLTDDEKFPIYKQLSNAYKNSDPEKLEKYARKVLEFAIKKKKDNYSIATSYYYIGIAHHTRANIDSAFIYYQKALNFAFETDDKQTETSAYISIGFIYSDKGDQIKALEYFQKALSIAESTNNIQQQVNILGNIGTIYRRMDNDSHALKYFERVQSLSEEANLPFGKCIAYFNIGGIYENQEEFEKALEYGLKTLDISRSTGDKQYEVVSLLSIAQAYYSDHFKDYDKAEKYATEGLKVSEEYGDPQMIMHSHGILADIYRLQGQFEKCDITASKAWEIDTTNIVSGKDFITNIVFANIYLGNKDKAASYLEKLFVMTEKINDSNVSEALAEMEIKYETEKKEIRIATLEEEKKIYIGLGIAIIIVFLLGIGLLVYRHRLTAQKKKLAEQQIIQLEQEKELIIARASLDAEKAEREIIARDLHDGIGTMLSVVKNNMDIIKSYSIIENKELDYFNKALDGLDKSIIELRRVAHHIMPAILVEKGLFVALDDFCRSIPEVEFHFAEPYCRFDQEKELVLYRCAYELVNNALRHAGASHIDVHLNMDEKTVYLSVVDNGCGFDPQTASMGMGINNMRIRLSIFNGRIDIYSKQEKGTEVNIELDS